MPFSSYSCLLRHYSEVHKIQDQCDNVDEKPTPSLSQSPSLGEPAALKMSGASKGPRVRSFQTPNNLIPKDNLTKENGFGCEEGARCVVPPPPPPPAFYGKTTSVTSDDNVEMKGFAFLDTVPESKQRIKLPPKPCFRKASIPTSISSDQMKENSKTVMVAVDFLQKLESKISDLEARVEECEDRPSSPTMSLISDSQDSVDSVSDLDNRSIREATDSRHYDDDIIIFEPEENQERRVKINEPGLTIARLKCVGAGEQFETIESVSPRHQGLGLSCKPLLTLIEDHCSNGKLWRKRLEIASPAFCELLKEVSHHDIDDMPLSHDGVLRLTEPFMVLFLNRKQLADHVRITTESSQAKEHAEFILNFLIGEFSHISRMLDNFESVTPPNLVKYCDLWMLYRPGTTVYSRANGEWEAFIIDCLDGMQIRRPSPDNHHALTRLDISAWSMNFDGEVYGRVWSLHCVAPFHGVKDISSLPLVPEKFLVDRNAVRESLLSRGKKFCSLQVQHCQSSEISPSQSARVMVDHLTYQRRNGWLISVNGKYGPSSAKEMSWKDNRYSDWDTSAEAIDRRPRLYTPQRSLVRHFENEYCNRDYELESIDKAEDTQAEACRSYSIDCPSHIVVSEYGKYNVIRSDAEMDELSLLLCPQHVRGFCFQDKVWSECIFCLS